MIMFGGNFCCWKSEVLSRKSAVGSRQFDRMKRTQAPNRLAYH